MNKCKCPFCDGENDLVAIEADHHRSKQVIGLQTQLLEQLYKNQEPAIDSSVFSCGLGYQAGILTFSTKGYSTEQVEVVVEAIRLVLQANLQPREVVKTQLSIQLTIYDHTQPL